MSINKKVIILGGGYSGLQVALVLAKEENLETILIDKNSYHELLPELPYRINKEDCKTTIPFAELIEKHNIKFIQDQALKINYQNQQVDLKSGGNINFDYLVLALGSHTNYFNIPGLKENSLGFITTSQVDAVNEKINDNFEKAKNKPSNYAELMSVVVGGGGLTGIEVVGELLDKLPKLAESKRLNPDDIKIYLVEALDNLLSGADKKLSAKITNYFQNHTNLELVLNTPISAAALNSVELANGRTIKAETIIWTGGIRGNTFFDNLFVDENGQDAKWPLGRGFRLEVDEFYKVKGLPKTYAAGDNALIMNPENNLPFPLNGQAAYQQGRALAEYIIADINGKSIKPKKIKLQGILVSLGPKVGTGTLWLSPFKFQLPLGKISRLFKSLVELRYSKIDIRK